MSEGLPKQFSSPEEEISSLREKIALRERELLARGPEVDKSDIETVGKKFDELDAKEQDYLLNNLEDAEDEDVAKKKTALYSILVG